MIRSPVATTGSVPISVAGFDTDGTSATASSAASAAVPADGAERFLSEFEAALADGSFTRLVLSKPRPGLETEALRIVARPLAWRGESRCAFTDSHATRDVATHLDAASALSRVRELLATRFLHAHLQAAGRETQLRIARKHGRSTVIHGKGDRTTAAAADRPGPDAMGVATTGTPALAAAPPPPPLPAPHDRAKHRYVDVGRAFLTELGVTTAEHRVVPAMARKWKQINKFVEVLDHALGSAGLKTAARLEVVDFGSGKGYLTFAAHDHLRHTLGIAARVTGIELRAELAELCDAAARRLGLDGLAFRQGDVRSAALESIDVMIALHACDTATDHAIHTGIRAGAALIVCSPCCHRELRPQLLSPHPLRPVLRHGVHLGQHAEMLTDTLRAMLLEASGYDTQVFEFVALEHSQKNKMILAVKRPHGTRDAAAAWREVDELKAFYGVRDQCLEALLRPTAPALP